MPWDLTGHEGRAPPDLVNDDDLLAEVFRVRFHCSMIACGSISLTIAEGRQEERQRRRQQDEPGKDAQHPAGQPLPRVQELARDLRGDHQGEQEHFLPVQRDSPAPRRDRPVRPEPGHREEHEQGEEQHAAKGTARGRGGLSQADETLRLRELAGRVHVVEYEVGQGRRGARLWKRV